ncbi:MAG UNVERIFIED_CONTAM: hypothetical protein LVR18_24370 [Planctomycetaceae bacterium]
MNSSKVPTTPPPSSWPSPSNAPEATVQALSDGWKTSAVFRTEGVRCRALSSRIGGPYAIGLPPNGGTGSLKFCEKTGDDSVGRGFCRATTRWYAL